jgi:hypothetical protein
VRGTAPAEEVPTAVAAAVAAAAVRNVRRWIERDMTKPLGLFLERRWGEGS